VAVITESSLSLIALEKYFHFGIAALTFADKKLASGDSTNILLSALFENRALTRIFGPKREEVTGVDKTTYEELNDLYSSTSIVRAIKSRRIRWAGYVERMGERRGLYRVLVEKRGKETTRKIQA
jgi:hypothetical protein